jgi:hypothetical protein
MLLLILHVVPSHGSFALLVVTLVACVLVRYSLAHCLVQVVELLWDHKQRGKKKGEFLNFLFLNYKNKNSLSYLFIYI